MHASSIDIAGAIASCPGWAAADCWCIASFENNSLLAYSRYQFGPNLGSLGINIHVCLDIILEDSRTILFCEVTAASL